MSDAAGAFAEIHHGGIVSTLTGRADIGQDPDTVPARIVDEKPGMDYKDARIISADTGRTPDAETTPPRHRRASRGRRSLPGPRAQVSPPSPR